MTLLFFSNIINFKSAIWNNVTQPLLQQGLKSLAELFLPLENYLFFSGVHIHIYQIWTDRKSHVHKLAVTTLWLKNVVNGLHGFFQFVVFNKTIIYKKQK